MACGDVTGIRVPYLCFYCVQHSGADDAGMYNSVCRGTALGVLYPGQVLCKSRYVVTL